MKQLPIVLAITGASGAPYGVRLLEVLAGAEVPVWLIVSGHGFRLLQAECGIADLDGLKAATGGNWCGVRAFPTMIAVRLAGVGIAAHRWHGDLSLFHGHRLRGGDRLQPLAGGACRRRDAQGTTETHPRAAGDADVAGAPAQPGGSDGGGRDRAAGRTGFLSPTRRRSPNWWTSSCSASSTSSTSTSRWLRAGRGEWRSTFPSDCRARRTTPIPRRG